MNDQPVLVLAAWTPEVIWTRLKTDFPEVQTIDARERPVLERHLPRATMVYGCPPAELLAQAAKLRWLQLSSAGVPLWLAEALKNKEICVTNLAGLYGPTIAEHALALMLMLARNLHRAVHQQGERSWQRDLAQTMVDLHGQTAALVGLGNIGQAIARLCRAFGMRVVGCRRRPQPTPGVDQVYPRERLPAMLGEAEFVVVAAPLTRETEGMLGAAEFAAMKPGVFYVNIARGAVAREEVLLTALQSGHVAGAGLDVFAVEQLPADHPFWTMPQVILTPHYSGETVNLSAQPGELLLRNLGDFLAGRPIGHRVDLDLGY